MSKLERIVGTLMLAVFICTLTVITFDQLSERTSSVIGDLTESIAQRN